MNKEYLSRPVADGYEKPPQTQLFKYIYWFGISFLFYSVKETLNNLPEKTPKELTTRNGEAADTMKATAVVNEVKNIARAERLQRMKIIPNKSFGGLSE